MPYEQQATSATPALIICALDVRASMRQQMGGKTRVEIVMDALETTLRRMVVLSTRGSSVLARYRLAMFAYSDAPEDPMGGILDIGRVVAKGVPLLEPLRNTNAARAFYAVERLLQAELPNLAVCPAPLVCHVTDRERTGADPRPIVRPMREMRNEESNVLVENIFISNDILAEAVPSTKQWSGVNANTRLRSEDVIPGPFTRGRAPTRRR